jgi:hypothetical protein
MKLDLNIKSIKCMRTNPQSLKPTLYKFKLSFLIPFRISLQQEWIYKLTLTNPLT